MTEKYITFCKELRKVTAHLPGGKKAYRGFFILYNKSPTKFTLLGCSKSLSFREEKGICCKVKEVILGLI